MVSNLRVHMNSQNDSSSTRSSKCRNLTPGSEDTADGRPGHRRRPSVGESADQPFYLVLGPRDRLVYRLAVVKAPPHRRDDSAIEDLHRDIRRSRIRCKARFRVVPWAYRVVVHRAPGGFDVFPDLEVRHAHLWRDIEPLRGHPPFPHLTPLPP